MSNFILRNRTAQAREYSEGSTRRKIRLLEVNANCRHLKNLSVKGLCGRCSSVCGAEPHSPPLIHCLRLNSILIHTGKGGRGGGS
jgi:hypothetical protein